MATDASTVDETDGLTSAEGRAPSGDAVARLESLSDARPARNLLGRRTVIGTSNSSDVHVSGDGTNVSCVVSHGAEPLGIRAVSGPIQVNGFQVRFATLCDRDEIAVGQGRFRVRTNLDGHRLPRPFVGRFRVRELVGSGGMAWLFAAEDTATGGRAAIKLLPSRHSEQTLMQFRLEARAVLQLAHDNVVQALRGLDEPDVHAILFEFVEGINLAEYVAQLGPVPWPLACCLAEQAARGLQHTHERGIVHRDVKPSNLQIRSDGTVKLLDFGLALVRDDPIHLRLVELLPRRPLGTPDYIAPEQIQRSHDVDYRADLYALGGTLYFALTGSVPFPIQPPHRKLRAHRRSMPRTIRRLAPEVPRPVERIVWRLLAKDPAERFGSAGEVADALRRFARRQRIDFDYHELLEARSDVARRRARLLEAKLARSTEPTGPQGGTHLPASLVAALERGLARES